MYRPVAEWNVLLEKKKVRFLFENRTILVAACDGLPYAIADKCPHMGYPLFNGRYENGILQCKEHGLEIDVRTGLVHNLAKAAFLKMPETSRSVRTYPAKIENGQVFVDL